VDRTNGDVYIIVLANGLWKSKDKGAVFERIDGGKVAYTPNGGEGNPAGLDADPDGNRFMCFMMHGTGALVLDSGATVVKCPINSTDCGATDWSDGKTMIAVYHEQNGKAGISLDGGATWTNIGAGFEGVGVFDAKTFVATKTKEPGISRSQDGGLTWAKVSDLMPTGEAMRVFKGVGYFTSKKGLLVSKDKGATWAVQGKPIECKVGPLFGKNEKHLVVGTNEGLMETTDGGQTWNLAAPIPDWPEWTVPPYLAIKHSFKCVRWGGTVFCPSIYAWDPQNDVFYASTYSGPVLKYQR